MDNFRDIIFNGRSLRSFGFYLKKNIPIIDFPKREVSTTLIAGSVTGEAITDKGTYGNIERTYSFKTIPSEIPYSDESKLLKAFIDWAKDNRETYGQLKDSARKGYFCNAFLKEITEFKKLYDGVFEVTLVFSCQPYWYLFSGQQSIKKTIDYPPVSFNLSNPEKYPSYPYFLLTRTDGKFPEEGATATLTVNNTSLTISNIVGYIEIDSEIKNVFKGATPKNNTVTGVTFPVLEPGINTITLASSDPWPMWELSVTPRWRCM